MRTTALLLALGALMAPAAPLAADDDRQVRRLEVSRVQAIRIAQGYGMVRVTEIEQDDGGWEVEGRDHRGRELQVTIDRRGRVISVERDGGDDDD